MHARIPLTHSCYSSLSLITPNRSTRLNLLSVQSWCRWLLVGLLTLLRLCRKVQWWMSLMSSSLLLQQGPVCHVRLIWMVFEMGGRWPRAADLWDVDSRICSISLLAFSCYSHLAFFSIRLVSVHVVHPCSRIYGIAALKKFLLFYKIGQMFIWLIN